MTLAELRQQRHEKAKACREILTKAEAEGRDLNREERASFDQLDAEIGDVDRAMAAAGHGAEPGQLRAGELVGIGQGAAARSSFSLGREQRMVDWERARDRRSDTFSVEEVEAFSLGRAVRGLVSGKWDGADFERRALGEGSDATGGVLVPTSLSSAVIDRVRNRARVLEAGATLLPMDTDTVDVPRVAAGVQGAWKLENAPVAVADPAFERVRLNAKTLAVMVKLSYELFEDMTPEASDAITREITGALALELDRVALRGTGIDPEPRGIRNTVGATIIANGANGVSLSGLAAGAALDFLVDGAAAVMAANFDPNAVVYASRTAATLAKARDGQGQPIQRPALIADLDELVTNQVPNNLVAGTSADTSEAYFGEWPQLLIGVRPSLGVRVKVLDQRYADTMSIGLLAWLRADVALAHPEAFAVSTGLRP